MQAVAAKIDELGKVGWLGLAIASFILWWPVGLLVTIYIIGSGRMSYWSCGRGRAEKKMERMSERARRWYGTSHSSGNAAFDEYREETLRRLEEEQGEFREFLERLRHAKDKAEFDQFMSERRTPPSPTP